MVKIIVAPNDVLAKNAKYFEFRKNNKILRPLLKQMEDALLAASDPKGVGLAAPQIGKSVAVFMAKPKEKSRIQTFINPKIVELDQSLTSNKPSAKRKKLKKLEGCLSLPNIWGEVLRAESIVVSYQDKNGRKKSKKFSGFMATIVQHEIDHLHGILFPRRVLEQKGKLYKSHKNEKGQDEFEELSI